MNPSREILIRLDEATGTATLTEYGIPFTRDFVMFTMLSFWELVFPTLEIYKANRGDS